jgi:hypothetical protein
LSAPQIASIFQAHVGASRDCSNTRRAVVGKPAFQRHESIALPTCPAVYSSAMLLSNPDQLSGFEPLRAREAIAAPPSPPVSTENSIAQKKREQRSRGNDFLGLRKHLSNRRVTNDPPYRLPEQRITAAGSVYILKEGAMAQAARRSYRW